MRSVLIANRGEIAVRIIRACRDLGLETVAVYSDADRLAPHVRLADRAYRVGPPPSAESYLRIDKLLEVARESGADAIHPGYGFLSERASFARAVTEAGLTFIGPKRESIEQMGDKTAARQLMIRHGVPTVPGTEDAIDDVATAERIAAEIGYPVLIKAAAGGGGKGMRVVAEPGELGRSMTAARNEAQSAFGDGRVYIEKYVLEPRHIEIQVLADAHGHTVHLGERECSVQRRHQKVVEEAPSAIVGPELRAEMGAAAVRAAEACGYIGAGTIEFLVDAERKFYFLEMNTRLQVEHPVTELVTGIDLVKAQLRVAMGEPLGFTQADVTMTGHAVECRVYAEDPLNNFLPSIGRLERLVPPSGPGVRVDSGVEQGMTIPIYYDPMIAKLATFGLDRTAALDRMRGALDEYVVVGVQTTIPFCRFVIDHPAFRSGAFTTGFVAEHFRPELLQPSADDPLAALAALVAAHDNSSRTPTVQTVTASGSVDRSAWTNRRLSGSVGRRS